MASNNQKCKAGVKWIIESLYSLIDSFIFKHLKYQGLTILKLDGLSSGVLW